MQLTGLLLTKACRCVKLLAATEWAETEYFNIRLTRSNQDVFSELYFTVSLTYIKLIRKKTSYISLIFFYLVRDSNAVHAPPTEVDDDVISLPSFILTRSKKKYPHVPRCLFEKHCIRWRTWTISKVLVHILSKWLAHFLLFIGSLLCYSEFVITVAASYSCSLDPKQQRAAYPHLFSAWYGWGPSPKATKWVNWLHSQCHSPQGRFCFDV